MYSKNIIFLMVLILWALGCGQDNLVVDNSTAKINIAFQLAPGASMQSNINKIEVTVSAPDIESRSIEITGINKDTHSVIGSIMVPVGINRTFKAKALDADGSPVFSGLSENVEITDTNIPIIIPIQLTLAPIIIGIQSQQKKLNLGDNYTVEMYFNDTPKLFAFTCELEFNEDLLEPVEIVSGDFFGVGDNVLFIEDSKLPGRQKNHLNMGITCKAGDAGVFGSGAAFKLTFKTIGKGDAVITLLRNNTLVLKTPAFETIESSRIIIEPNIPVKIE